MDRQAVSWKTHVIYALIALIFSVALVWGRTVPVEVSSSAVLGGRTHRLGRVTVQREIKWIRSDCTYLEITGYMTDSLFPPHVHPVGVVPLGKPILEASSVARSWQVGAEMPSGPAVLHSYLTAHCFPFYGLWPISVELAPLPVEVGPVPGEPDAARSGP